MWKYFLWASQEENHFPKTFLLPPVEIVVIEKKDCWWKFWCYENWESSLGFDRNLLYIMKRLRKWRKLGWRGWLKICMEIIFSDCNLLKSWSDRRLRGIRETLRNWKISVGRKATREWTRNLLLKLRAFETSWRLKVTTRISGSVSKQSIIN